MFGRAIFSGERRQLPEAQFDSEPVVDYFKKSNNNSHSFTMRFVVCFGLLASVLIFYLAEVGEAAALDSDYDEGKKNDLCILWGIINICKAKGR